MQGNSIVTIYFCYFPGIIVENRGTQSLHESYMLVRINLVKVGEFVESNKLLILESLYYIFCYPKVLCNKCRIQQKISSQLLSEWIRVQSLKYLVYIQLHFWKTHGESRLK